MKKLIAVLLSAVFAVCFGLTLVACGGGSDGSKEKIVFACNSGYLLDFQERIEEFNKIYPDIEVEIQAINAGSWGEMLQTISTDIASGVGPDIADIARGCTSLQSRGCWSRLTPTSSATPKSSPKAWMRWTRTCATRTSSTA